MECWSIYVHKDYLKFSAAHFLIFPDGSAERLHGHNYKVHVRITSPLDRHGLVLNFKEIKPMVRSIADSLDELLLIPGKHHELTAERRADGATIIRYRERLYQVPSSDVLILPVSNTSAENLATWFGHELRRRLAERYPKMHLAGMKIAIEETPGQRGIYCFESEKGDSSSVSSTGK